MRRWLNGCLSVLVICYLSESVRALTCHCDDDSQCQSGTCQPPKNWYGPEHCQLLYDPTVNGEKPWRGCTLANSNCDIVSESQSVDVTFIKGKLSSFGGCCGEDQCDDRVEAQLNRVKNATCTALAGNDKITDSFSCNCDPNDMLTLFDLSVERGVQWLSTAIGDAKVLSNASNVYESTIRLRQRMAGFCTNGMCNANTIAASGIAIPADAFPVCAHFHGADTGKAVRGCTFAPRTIAQKNGVRRLQSSFPTNPIAGAYDVRVGVNVSDRYNFIFECRWDMCNERQAYENVLSQCMPGIQLPTRSGGVGEVGHNHEVHVNETIVETVIELTTPSVLDTDGHEHNVQSNETAPGHHHHVDVNETVVEMPEGMTEIPTTTEEAAHHHHADMNETIVVLPDNHTEMPVTSTEEPDHDHHAEVNDTVVAAQPVGTDILTTKGPDHDHHVDSNETVVAAQPVGTSVLTTEGSDHDHHDSNETVVAVEGTAPGVATTVLAGTATPAAAAATAEVHRDETTTAHTHPGSSAARQVLHLFFIVPVILLIAFK